MLLFLAAVVTTLLSIFFGVLARVGLDRAVSVGFYLVGSFLLVGGFFAGNRGPLRLKHDDAYDHVPFRGSRIVRWATPDEREDAINTSAIYVFLGLALIVVGVLVDSRYALL